MEGKSTIQVIYKKKIESTDFINENREIIQKYINQVLYSLVDGLEEYVEQDSLNTSVHDIADKLNDDVLGNSYEVS